MHNAFLSPKVKPDSGGRTPKAETVFLNLKGAQESIPRNRFRLPMQPGGPVRQPYSYSVASPHRLFKNSSTEAKIPALFYVCTVCVCVFIDVGFLLTWLQSPPPPPLFSIYGQHQSLCSLYQHVRNAAHIERKGQCRLSILINLTG